MAHHAPSRPCAAVRLVWLDVNELLSLLPCHSASSKRPCQIVVVQERVVTRNTSVPDIDSHAAQPHSRSDSPTKTVLGNLAVGVVYDVGDGAADGAATS
jgi:hypothetical protein